MYFGIQLNWTDQEETCSSLYTTYTYCVYYKICKCAAHHNQYGFPGPGYKEKMKYLMIMSFLSFCLYISQIEPLVTCELVNQNRTGFTVVQ